MAVHTSYFIFVFNTRGCKKMTLNARISVLVLYTNSYSHAVFKFSGVVDRRGV